MAYPYNTNPFYSSPTPSFYSNTTHAPPFPSYPYYNPPSFSTTTPIPSPSPNLCFTHGYSPPSHNPYISSPLTYSPPSYSIPTNTTTIIPPIPLYTPHCVTYAQASLPPPPDPVYVTSPTITSTPPKPTDVSSLPFPPSPPLLPSSSSATPPPKHPDPVSRPSPLFPPPKPPKPPNVYTLPFPSPPPSRTLQPPPISPPSPPAKTPDGEVPTSPDLTNSDHLISSPPLFPPPHPTARFSFPPPALPSKLPEPPDPSTVRRRGEPISFGSSSLPTVFRASTDPAPTPPPPTKPALPPAPEPPDLFISQSPSSTLPPLHFHQIPSLNEVFLLPPPPKPPYTKFHDEIIEILFQQHPKTHTPLFHFFTSEFHNFKQLEPLDLQCFTEMKSKPSITTSICVRPSSPTTAHHVAPCHSPVSTLSQQLLWSIKSFGPFEGVISSLISLTSSHVPHLLQQSSIQPHTLRQLSPTPSYPHSSFLLAIKTSEATPLCTVRPSKTLSNPSICITKGPTCLHFLDLHAVFILPNDSLTQSKSLYGTSIFRPPLNAFIIVTINKNLERWNWLPLNYFGRGVQESNGICMRANLKGALKLGKLTTFDQWDPGEELFASPMTSPYQFKQWDPGKKRKIY